MAPLRILRLTRKGKLLFTLICKKIIGVLPTEKDLAVSEKVFKINYEYNQSYQKSGPYIFRPKEKTLWGLTPYSIPLKATRHKVKILSQIKVQF
jgi:hypothetical protein